LLTVKWIIAALLFGMAGVVSTLMWLWQTDRSPAVAVAEVAQGVKLPVGARGGWSPSFWATIIFLVVDATVFASIMFSHLHVALRADVCPPASAALPALSAVLLSSAGSVLSALLLWWSGRRLHLGALTRWQCAGVLLAAALALAAFGALLAGHGQAGLAPSAQAWSATVAALLGYHGWRIALLTVAAAYLAVRIWQGLVTPRQRATFDNVLAMWLAFCAQAVFVAAWPHVVAGWLS
jgi:cytochrome c oxidase subunit I+III